MDRGDVVLAGRREELDEAMYDAASRSDATMLQRAVGELRVVSRARRRPCWTTAPGRLPEGAVSRGLMPDWSTW